MVEPIRIQRKRSKGWKMPKNTVYVGRPTKWGNPIKVEGKTTRKSATESYRNILGPELAYAVTNKEYRALRYYVLAHIHELKGKNLACWCPLDEPCHVDVLLAMANPPLTIEEKKDAVTKMLGQDFSEQLFEAIDNL